MKFLHLADLHLDSTFSGLPSNLTTNISEIKNSTNQAFEKAVDDAIAENVDFVVIVGDIFDLHQPSPQTQLFFAEQIKRLVDQNIYVTISFGNHDYLDRNDFFVAPDNHLFVFNGEPEIFSFTTRNNIPVDIAGFSYQQNHLTEDQAAKFPVANPNHFSVATIHGSVKTSNDEQNVYAPFTITELLAKNYQYYALGHIHKIETLHEEPFIGYSGNTQGRNINELGNKGFYQVTVDDQSFKTTQKFVKTSVINYQEINLSLTSETNQTDLNDQIIQNINDEINQKTFVILNILGAENLSDEQAELLQDENLWLNLNRQLTANSEIVRVNFIVDEKIGLNPVDQDYFDQARDNVFTTDNLKAPLKKLATQYQFIGEHLDDEELLTSLKTKSEFSMAQNLLTSDGDN